MCFDNLINNGNATFINLMSQASNAPSTQDGSVASNNTEREDIVPTKARIDNMKETIKFWNRENKLFIEYANQHGKDFFPQGTQIEAKQQKRKNNQQKKKSMVLPVSKKLEIATQVNEKIEEMIKAEHKKFSIEIESVRARLVQIGVREKEIEKERNQFVREILEESTDERTGHIIGERLLKWYDDTVKSKETKKETLKLKKDSMSVKTKQTRARLEQKRDLGEKLQQVDYDQLQIDNENYQKDIKGLSSELAKLQKTSSSVVSRLQTARTILSEEENECEEMRTSIEQKRKAIDKYQKESDDVESDQKKLNSNNEEITTKKSEYRVPDVTDYIDKKANIYEQAKIIKNWERKVQLATMNVKRLQKELEVMDTPRGP